MIPVMGKPVSLLFFQNLAINDAEQLAYLSSLVCVSGDQISDSVMPL